MGHIFYLLIINIFSLCKAGECYYDEYYEPISNTCIRK